MIATVPGQRPLSVPSPARRAHASWARDELVQPASLAPHRRILVIDEHPDRASSFADLLSLLGHPAAFALSVDHALASCISWRPEIVFIGLELLDKGARALVRRIESAVGRHGARIVGVTGSRHRDDENRALEAGCDAILYYLADQDEIQQTIAQVMLK
jgi:CheY-like chemotaxis protein